MSSGLTKAQRLALEKLSVIGRAYGSGTVPTNLVRKGYATFFGYVSGIEITPAGRQALKEPTNTTEETR